MVARPTGFVSKISEPVNPVYARWLSQRKPTQWEIEEAERAANPAKYTHPDADQWKDEKGKWKEGTPDEVRYHGRRPVRRWESTSGDHTADDYLVVRSDGSHFENRFESSNGIHMFYSEDPPEHLRGVTYEKSLDGTGWNGWIPIPPAGEERTDRWFKAAQRKTR